ncbi:MAG: hypothetical protein ACYTE0_13470 [Planctomycetota bacterium]|jgi:hypothetical protein
MKTGFVIYLAALALSVSTAVAAYPEPEVVQKGRQWTLNVDYSAPEQITLQLPDT